MLRIKHLNLIENLTNEHREELELETDCDFELESDDFNLDQVVESAVIGPRTLFYQMWSQ